MPQIHYCLCSRSRSWYNCPPVPVLLLLLLLLCSCPCSSYPGHSRLPQPSRPRAWPLIHSATASDPLIPPFLLWVWVLTPRSHSRSRCYSSVAITVPMAPAIPVPVASVVAGSVKETLAFPFVHPFAFCLPLMPASIARLGPVLLLLPLPPLLGLVLPHLPLQLSLPLQLPLPMSLCYHRCCLSPL